MNVDLHGAPVYFKIPILGGIPITSTIVVTWGIMIVLTGLCIWLTHDLKVTNISKRQAVAEFLVTTAEKFVKSNMGEAWGAYVPFISTIMVMSVSCSLISLIGFYPPTADLPTEFAWALTVFILITYYKIKSNGIGGYLKSFCDPIFLMAPFNFLGEIFRPVSMSFRHFGNILSGVVISTLIYSVLVTANHALFSLLPGMIGELLGAIPFLSVGIPAALSLYFDWFGGCMQAFIFCMLSMVFISSAKEG